MSVCIATKDSAKKIRKALKSKGISSRQVSVRAKNCTLSSSIHVTIKDPDVELAPVQEAAEGHEEISYCEITNEILGGGNTFVSVSYDYDAAKARADKVIDAVKEACSEADKGSSIVPVDGTDFSVSKSHRFGYTVWENGSALKDAGDVNSVARIVARTW